MTRVVVAVAAAACSGSHGTAIDAGSDLPACGAVATCAPQPTIEPASDAFTSGTRLKVVRWDFGTGEVWTSGSRLAESAIIDAPYFDTVRGELCYPQPWSDGTLRCTPLQQAEGADYDGSPGNVVLNGASPPFADAACTQPGDSGNEGEYHAYGVRTCGAIEHLYRLSATVVTQAVQSVRAADGSCHPDPNAGTQVRLAEVLEAADFAEITSTTVPSSDPDLGLELQTSADGMVRPTKLRDLRLQVACKYTPATYGAAALMRCLPEWTFWTDVGGGYADAACTEALYARRTPPGCALPTSLVVVDVPFDCPLTASFAPLHATSEAPVAIIVQHVGCRDAGTLPTGVEYFAPDAPIAMAVHERCPDPSPVGRIAPLYVQAANLRLRGGVFDAQLGVECEMRLLDGAWRCLPNVPAVYDAAIATGAAYGDAQCMQPLQQVSGLGPACCDAVPAPYVLFRSRQALAIVGYRKTIGPHAGPVFRGQFDGSCKVSTIDPPSLFVDLGPMLGLDTLATGTMIAN